MKKLFLIFVLTVYGSLGAKTVSTRCGDLDSQLQARYYTDGNFCNGTFQMSFDPKLHIDDVIESAAPNENYGFAPGQKQPDHLQDIALEGIWEGNFQVRCPKGIFWKGKTQLYCAKYSANQELYWQLNTSQDCYVHNGVGGWGLPAAYGPHNWSWFVDGPNGPFNTRCLGDISARTFGLKIKPGIGENLPD